MYTMCCIICVYIIYTYFNVLLAHRITVYYVCTCSVHYTILHVYNVCMYVLGSIHVCIYNVWAVSYDESVMCEQLAGGHNVCKHPLCIQLYLCTSWHVLYIHYIHTHNIVVVRTCYTHMAGLSLCCVVRDI